MPTAKQPAAIFECAPIRLNRSKTVWRVKFLQYDGAHYLLCKGKEKVTAEIGLSYLAYNLKRAINMVGVKGLIEAMG